MCYSITVRSTSNIINQEASHARSGRRIHRFEGRTDDPCPWVYDHAVEPMPEAEALSFLLPHSFRGHRRIVRSFTIAEPKRMRMARADSVDERMTLTHRVWRAITESVPAPRNPKPELIQVIQYQHWSYQDGW